MEPDMIVDCDRCVVRGGACQDCVITVLLGAPPEGVELDGAQRRALDMLAEAGMVPRLQLVDRLAPAGTNPGGHRPSAQWPSTEWPKTEWRSVHQGRAAERCSDNGERSRRHVS
jgi:hypothetical protein